MNTKHQRKPWGIFLLFSHIFAPEIVCLTESISYKATHSPFQLPSVNYLSEPVLDYLPTSGTMSPYHGIIGRVAVHEAHAYSNRFGRLLFQEDEVNFDLGYRGCLLRDLNDAICGRNPASEVPLRVSSFFPFRAVQLV